MRQSASAGDSTSVCAALDEWLLDHPTLRTIAAYSALPDEVDLTSSIQRHPHIRWVFPRVDGDDLYFHAAEHLSRGSFGISEPAPDSPITPLSQIDAFLCPGLAFCPQGNRLGRGRGFYDRLLSKIRPDALKIGICFPQSRVPDTYPEEHDVAMDHVIS
jgi:5-formyltetrahydrofolate cyclo-ligase